MFSSDNVLCFLSNSLRGLLTLCKWFHRYSHPYVLSKSDEDGLKGTEILLQPKMRYEERRDQ